MYSQVEKPKENKSRAVANSVTQKKSNVKQGFGFVDNRQQSVAQMVVENGTITGSTITIQRTDVNGTQVYEDNRYPVWKMGGIKWHLTMKDPTRWHITKEDRSNSYWFECDAGVVTSVKPKKSEYGSQKKKHKPLEDAPEGLYSFVSNNIMAIIRVTEKVPSDW